MCKSNRSLWFCVTFTTIDKAKKNHQTNILFTIICARLFRNDRHLPTLSKIYNILFKEAKVD